jgi:SsrA-binding protein
LETWEAGIELTGPEVKSLKAGQGDLKGAYVRVRSGASSGGHRQVLAELINAYIPPYMKAGPLPDYNPRRTRRLLLHRGEIGKLLGLLETKGLTLVPLSVYTRNHLVKLTLGLARGKSAVDKREVIKKRDLDRSVRERMMRRVR